MKPYFFRLMTLLIAVLICIIFTVNAQAGNGVETAGDVLVFVLPAISGGLALNYKDGTGALQFVESAALALGTTFILKYSINEERPNHKDHSSFPSAHSSASFASAEFIRKRYGWEFGIPAYAVASFIAYSRVDARQHYAHDVIIGAAIGIGSSYLFTRPYKDWKIEAVADPKYYGITLSRAW